MTSIDYKKVFSEEEIKELQEAFSLFDTDSNGLLTINEIKSIMNRMFQYPTEEELKDMLSVRKFYRIFFNN